MKKRKTKDNWLAASLAMALWLMPGSTNAEQPDYELDPLVVTATRVEQKASEVPGNVVVISAQQIEQKGAHTLADALEGIPGVSIVRQGGPAAIASPFILGSDRVLVMIDGKRLRLPQGEAWGYTGVNLNSILMDGSIERIEVVKGGLSTLYGADAVSGVIHIITHRGGGQPQSSIDVGMGNDHTRHCAYSYQARDKQWGWTFNALKDSTDGQRPNSGYDGKNVTFRLDRQVDRERTISFNYNYYGDRVGYPGAVGPWSSLTDYGNTARHNWDATWARNRQGMQQVVRYYQNNQALTGENLGPIHIVSSVKAVDYQDGVKTSTHSTWLWGGEYRTEHVQSLLEGNVAHDSTIQAAYVQQGYTWNRYTFTTGMRYDHNSIYGGNWLPKASVVYQADRHTEMFGNWNRVFRSPTFDELYTVNPWMHGKPTLKPEKGWTMDSGIRHRLASGQEVQLSLFKHFLHNGINWAPDDPNDVWSPWHSDNVDTLVTTGVNASYSLRWSQNVHVQTGYTYLDVRKNNAPDPNVSHQALNLSLMGNDRKWAWRLNGTWNDKKNQLPSYVVVDAAISYQSTKNQRLYLQVGNLFDKPYQAIQGYPAQRRTLLCGIKQTL